MGRGGEGGGGGAEPRIIIIIIIFFARGKVFYLKTKKASRLYPLDQLDILYHLKLYTPILCICC